MGITKGLRSGLKKPPPPGGLKKSPPHPLKKKGTVEKGKVETSIATSIAKHTTSIPAGAGDGEHSAFIKGWTDNFKAQWGFDYTFDGGRDGKAVKTLLATKILRSDLLEIAKKAWNHQHTFSCKQASTIHGFCNNLNPIRTELKNETKTPAAIVPGLLTGIKALSTKDKATSMPSSWKGKTQPPKPDFADWKDHGEESLKAARSVAVKFRV